MVGWGGGANRQNCCQAVDAAAHITVIIVIISEPQKTAAAPGRESKNGCRHANPIDWHLLTLTNHHRHWLCLPSFRLLPASLRRLSRVGLDDRPTDGSQAQAARRTEPARPQRKRNKTNALDGAFFLLILSSLSSGLNAFALFVCITNVSLDSCLSFPLFSQPIAGSPINPTTHTHGHIQIDFWALPFDLLGSRLFDHTVVGFLFCFLASSRLAG